MTDRVETRAVPGRGGDGLNRYVGGGRFETESVVGSPAPTDLEISAPPCWPDAGIGRKHGHYFKACPYDEVDVYRVLELFGVTDAPIAHGIKKLLVAGGRGHKDIGRDIQDAIDTLKRWQDMREEDRLVAAEGDW